MIPVSLDSTELIVRSLPALLCVVMCCNAMGAGIAVITAVVVSGAVVVNCQG